MEHRVTFPARTDFENRSVAGRAASISGAVQGTGFQNQALFWVAAIRAAAKVVQHLFFAAGVNLEDDATSALAISGAACDRSSVNVASLIPNYRCIGTTPIGAGWPVQAEAVQHGFFSGGV